MLYEFETTTGAEAPAAGTGETLGSEGTTPAGESNTDTGASGSPPDTIPYSRFKEVNDAYSELKDFKGLAERGYDADSLRQLADFEAGFRADPISTWYQVAMATDGMPQEVKDLAQRHLTGSSVGDSTSPKPSGSREDGDEPEWAKQLREETKRLSESDAQRQQREAQEANNRALDGIISDWRNKDAADNIEESPSEREMLTFIMAHARSSSSTEEILERARAEYMGIVERAQGSAVKPGLSAGAPLPVPGGGALANVEGQPKTLAEASQRAKLRLEEAARSET